MLKIKYIILLILIILVVSGCDDINDVDVEENAKYEKISINNRKYYSEYIINQVLDILNDRSDE